MGPVEFPEEDPAKPLDEDPASRHPTGWAPERAGHRRRIRWVLVASVATCVALLTALFAFGLTRDPSILQSPLVGRGAPDFTLRVLDGHGVVKLSDYRGKVVVINFWASWCAACREEHPNLLAMWERYRDRGVVLLGIDFQDESGAARAFMRDMGGDWPILLDPGSRAAVAYGVYGVPETYFISRDGIIEYKQIGPSSFDLLNQQIQRLLRPQG